MTQPGFELEDEMEWLMLIDCTERGQSFLDEDEDEDKDEAIMYSDSKNS